MPLFIAVLLLWGMPSILQAQEKISDLQSVTTAVNHDDGGKTSERHMRNLLDTLKQEGCDAIATDKHKTSPAQLIFNSSPASEVKKQKPEYQLIVRAKTLTGELNVRGAILIHASRGINDLKSLKGEWISFVSKNSWSGYLLPIQLLHKAGINENTNKFYFVGNHVGAVSALLHKDVLVAVMAEPLAQRWAKQNGLSIVAVTDAVETGGWWMHRSVSKSLIQSCTQALLKLERSRHKALPAWINGFVIPE